MSGRRLPLEITSTAWSLLGLALLSILLYPRIRGRKNLPPGPRRLPLIGNIHQLPSDAPWSVFARWAEKYGNLIHADVFGQPIVIINSRKIAFDELFRTTDHTDCKSVSTSLGNVLTFLQHDDVWRHQRKIITPDLSPVGVAQFQGLQEREWTLQVKAILQNPDSIFSEIKWKAGIIAVRALYGYYIRSADDPFLTNALRTMEEFNRLSTPKASLAYRFLPRWTPGVTFFKDAMNYEQLHCAAANAPYEWCKENLKTGNALTPNVLCNHSIGGALDSNVSTASTFYMQMILHPEVQCKAQAEIDVVIGSGRLPSISDKPYLPYVRAILAESLRFMPPIPLCVPHALKEDDVYEGYFLPKGAWVMPNIWQIVRDPEVYPDPMTFNPGRYKGNDEAMDQVTNLVFGFGRRKCPGRLFAENSLFALLSSTLATCNISAGVDVNGKEELPKGLYTSGTIVTPEPFKISVRSRSAAAEALLAEVGEVIE